MTDAGRAVAASDDGSASASTACNVTFACDAYAPGLKYIWSAGSGATHSNTWFSEICRAASRPAR
jgi:hypothetical protein